MYVENTGVGILVALSALLHEAEKISTAHNVMKTRIVCLMATEIFHKLRKKRLYGPRNYNTIRPPRPEDIFFWSEVIVLYLSWSTEIFSSSPAASVIALRSSFCIILILSLLNLRTVSGTISFSNVSSVST